MTKVLLATTILAGVVIGGVAQAADMPLKAPRAAPVYSDWTGFYVFGFGGYSWGKIKPDDFDVGDITDGDLHNPKPKGGVFGFGGGYNWQYGAWVGGLEVDYGFSDEKENQSLRFHGDCPEFATTFKVESCGGGRVDVNSKIDALGSARVRAGYLFTPSVLAYGTAGLGWGRSEVNIAGFDAKPNLFGWVAGGGLEYKLIEHIRIRGEYLHYDFGSTGYAFQPIITLNMKTRD